MLQFGRKPTGKMAPQSMKQIMHSLFGLSPEQETTANTTAQENNENEEEN